MEERYADLLAFVEKNLDPSNRLSRPSVGTLRQKITEVAFTQGSLRGENKFLGKR